MILTGKEIVRQMERGNIVITPFSPSRVNPNSYNLCLGERISYYAPNDGVLDPKKPCEVVEVKIPEKGFVIHPGTIYLACTAEHTETKCYVPMLEGRSSLGRLGLLVHVTAGFGDIGFRGNWTLELACIQPVRIYPGMEVAQIYYHTVEGDDSLTYNGKYQDSKGVIPSRMDQDWKPLTQAPGLNPLEKLARRVAGLHDDHF